MPDLDDAAREALAPVRVSMRLVFAIGTGVWVIAAAVLGLLLVTGRGPDARWLAVCTVGAAIGLGGLVWARLRGQ